MEIDEDILSKYKGKYANIICTQIGSRAFQKSLSKSSVHFIDKLTECEVS